MAIFGKHFLNFGKNNFTGKNLEIFQQSEKSDRKKFLKFQTNQIRYSRKEFFRKWHSSIFPFMSSIGLCHQKAKSFTIMTR
jgi:hypothetical protein